MRDHDIDTLLDAYRWAAISHEEPDDGTKDWRTRVNQAANRMLLISKQLDSAGPKGLNAFARLLHADDPGISVAAAHHLLDFMHPDPDTRAEALSRIREAAAVHDENEWLENWENELQDE